MLRWQFLIDKEAIIFIVLVHYFHFDSYMIPFLILTYEPFISQNSRGNDWGHGKVAEDLFGDILQQLGAYIRHYLDRMSLFG